MSDLDALRRRAHVERMLARAERRHRQTLKLVEKWRAQIIALDREGIAAKQAKLWADDQPGADGPLILKDDGSR